jgi:multicomponent Na+:H+ antiporter subunit G
MIRPLWIEGITAFLMLAGAALMLLASVGLLRMPDIYNRISTATKASTLGVGCLLLAVVVFFDETGTRSRALAVLVFILLTAPVAAHILGRAAYLSGAPLWKDSCMDELDGRYEPETHILRSPPTEAEEAEPDGYAPPQRPNERRKSQ